MWSDLTMWVFHQRGNNFWWLFFFSTSAIWKRWWFVSMVLLVSLWSWILSFANIKQHLCCTSPPTSSLSVACVTDPGDSGPLTGATFPTPNLPCLPTINIRLSKHPHLPDHNHYCVATPWPRIVRNQPLKHLQPEVLLWFLRLRNNLLWVSLALEHSDVADSVSSTDFGFLI